MGLGLVASLVAAFAVLAWLYRRDRRRFERERGVLFDAAQVLFHQLEITRAPNEYPKLRGRYRGYEVTVDAVVDHIAVRKLPSLWLRATVLTEIPFRGVCDIMARAHNVEFYSPFGDLDHTLPLPAGWPDHLTVKSDDPDIMPPKSRLTPHVGLFRDERIKELLVTPRGVRVVRQAAQGSRAEYLVLRQALFGPVVVPRAQLGAMLDAAIALAEDLKSAAQPKNGAAA